MVEVVVPRAGNCPQREAVWRWVEGRWRERHPDWKLTEASGSTDPWVKAAAIEPAIDASDADVLVIADADVWVDGVGAAVDSVLNGAAWAVPHQLVRRLSESATAAVLAGGELDVQVDLAQEPYPGLPGGGLVVVPRLTALAVPLDRRYRSWGQEDASWGMALNCLAGEAWRGDAPLWHLWHPPQSRLDRKRGSHASWALRARYAEAKDDPAAMAALIEESRGTHRPTQHPGDDHPPHP